MTLAKLSQASDISVRSLTAFENGHKSPSGDTLLSLARALELPPSFFSAGDLSEIPVNEASFRALTKTSALDRDAALSAGSFAVSINDWIEARFDLPRADVPTFPHLEPEQAAELLRARWGLGESPIGNMIRLLEAHGIRVFSLAVDCSSVDAFSIRHNGNQPFIFLNTQKSGERGRFDAAHELGHLVLHSEHRIPHGPEAEREAQQFASAFLMPKSGLLAQDLHNASLDRIMKAKRKWNVAAMALTYRLHELGLTSDWIYRVTAKQLSQMGYRRSEPDGIPRETSHLLTKVFATLREKGISASQVAEAVHLNLDELNKHIFGLAPIALEGGRETTSPVRPKLQLIESGAASSKR
ncbi:Zn-dependent peptidase ImmA (M78 family) [Streptosporangium becharense]|uniref:Zn-dependent peptidase ImmA (M78 family) n=2 Tax=Streptosporangiaceae TaxID=2004 RepID=A0A7W9IHD0_9ACTN|nr:Zn-dependent peptidase ImmA (M78 family) [Streptosporangium becharense]MBB5820740.1 Zn-dependent peptidase ImmA (M78 family) [Streptosporangium becharense]